MPLLTDDERELMEQISKLETVNAELLAALEKAKTEMWHAGWKADDTNVERAEAVRMVDAAIAKASEQ